MKALNYKKLGTGQPLIILHGLFGSLDNWLTIGKQLAGEDYCVYLIDQRNHGHSFHADEFNYQLMSNDVLSVIKSEKLCDVILLGHSMGGKTAMHLALQHPEFISKLIVADIAPKYYPVHHTQIIDALKSVDVLKITSRGEAEKILNEKINNTGTVQFLMKNLYRKHHHFAWRFNLDAIEKNIENVGEEIVSDFPFTHKTLFIRGSKSDYIKDDDWFDIRTLFLNAELQTITGAGHWVHADAPDAFMECVLKFIK